MKIKMRVHFAGPNLTAAPGDEIERPDDEAMRLIKKGYAVALSAFPAVETAVPKPVVETRTVTHEDAGTAPDPDAPVHERVGRKPARKGKRR